MAEPAEQPLRHGGVWRGLWASLLIGLGIPASLLLVVAVAWVFRVPLAEWAVETAAASASLGPANVDIMRLGRDGFEIENLRFGDAVSADRITVTYQPLDVINGWVDDITVTGLIVFATNDQSSTDTDTRAFIKKAMSRTPLLPFRRLVLDDSQILFGSVKASADATLTAVSPQLIEVRAAATLTAPSVRTSATATGQIENAAGLLSTKLLIEPRAKVEGAGGAGDIALQASLDPTGQLSGTAEVRRFQGELETTTPARIGDITGTVNFASSLTQLEQLEGEVTLRDVAFGDEWSLAEVPLRIEFADGQGSVSLQVDAPENGMIVNANLHGTLPPADEHIDFAASGTLIPGNLRLPATASADGTVRFGVEGRVFDPLALASMPRSAWSKSIDFTARTDLDLTELALPGPVSVELVRGPLDWSLQDGVLLIDAAPGLRTQLGIPQELVGRLGNTVPETFDIEWGGNGRTPPSLRVAPTNTGWNLAFGAGALVPELGLAIETDMRLDLSQGFRPLELAMPFLLLDVADLAPLGLEGSAEVAVTDLAGDLTTASSQIIGSINATNWDGQGVQARDIAFEFDTSAAWANEQLTLLPEPSTRLQLGSAVRDSLTLNEVDVQLRPEGSASIKIGRDKSIAYELPIGPLMLNLKTPWGAADLSAPSTDVSGTREAATVTFDEARITAIDEFVAEDVAGTLNVKSDGRADLDVAIGRLRSTAEIPQFSELSAEIVGTRSADNEIAADLKLSNSLAGLDLRAQLTHDPQTNAGSAEVALQPLSFSALVQPTDISPRYAAQLSDVTGGLSGGGTVSWVDGTLESDLQLTLDAIDLTANNVKLRGVEGDLRVTGLKPPTTASGQQISLAIDQGTLGKLPVSATFQLRPDGILAIDRLELEAIAGRIVAEDLAIDTADPQTIETVLAVENLDLGQLLALTKVQGFTGTGRLSGQVPLRLENGQLAIADASLSSAGSGKVQFDRSKLPAALLARGDIVSMALETLTDFNYDSLDMQINKSLGGEGTVNVQLAGANPDVLEGHPFKFNIALESDFDELIRLITEGLSTADAVLFDAAADARR